MIFTPPQSDKTEPRRGGIIVTKTQTKNPNPEGVTLFWKHYFGNIIIIQSNQINIFRCILFQIFLRDLYIPL